MVELILVAEGQTEAGFVTDVLADHLATRGVRARPSVVRTSVVAGQVYRGGGNSWGHWKKDIQNWLRSPKPETRVTTLVDLYKLPKDWPGHDDTTRKLPPFDRVRALEQAAYDDISDRRFIPFVMLHEYETVFFADLDKVLVRYPASESAVAQIKNDLKDKHAPCVEWINDDPATAPSKRVARHIPEYEREKAAAGPVIAAAVGLPIIRAKCPHFASWLGLLESLDPQNPTHVWPVLASLPRPSSAEA